MKGFLTVLGEASAESGFWMPPQASDFAVKSDTLFDFILWLSIFFFVLLMGLMVYFAVKYRKKSEDQRTHPVAHNFKLEFLWSAVPTILLVVMFAWGFQDFTALSASPADSLRLKITAKQWNWTVGYPELAGRECTPEVLPDGTSETEFYVPVHRPFTTRMISEDVIHSFWIPAFRVKRDVIRNRYTGFTVTPTLTGRFRLYCAEYCGKDHSRMAGWVNVLSEEDWQAFTEDETRCNLDPAGPDYGEKLFVKHGCTGCHTTAKGGGVLKGPNLWGKFGEDEPLADGTTAKVDEDYIRESLLDPQARIVAGFEGVSMNSFRGRLSEQEIEGLINYLKGLTD